MSESSYAILSTHQTTNYTGSPSTLASDVFDKIFNLLMGTLGWQEPINKQVFKASFSGSGEYKIKAKQLADELNRVRILPREHAREVFTKIFGILSRTNPEAMHHIRRLEQAMKILGIGKVREGKL